MTELDWQMSTKLLPLAENMPAWCDERKARLISLAFCRRVSEFLNTPAAKQALIVVERAADGLIVPAEVDGTLEAMQHALQTMEAPVPSRLPPLYAHLALFHALAGPWTGIGTALVGERAALARWFAAGCDPHVLEAENQAQCDLVREIVGNPFRVVELSTPDRNVQDLARAIDASGRLDRLPELADMLLAQGPVDPDVIAHLRRPSCHARGCWALDALLWPGRFNGSPISA